MIIKYWKATVDRALPRFATCEKCGCEYTFTGRGSGKGIESELPIPLPGIDARQNAIDIATAAAHGRACTEPAACPDCGWYQKAMVAELRRRHLGLSAAGFLLMKVAGFLVLTWLVFQLRGNDDALLDRPLLLAAFAVAALGVFPLLLHASLAPRYDPNAAWPQRVPARPGEPEATRTPEYEQRLAAAQAAAVEPAWYVATAAGRQGPMSRNAVAAMRASALRPTDQVWTEGMAAWAPAGQVRI